MKPQEILKEVERIQGILGDDYEVKSLNGLVVVDKKEEPVIFKGWNYGNLSCELIFYFVFDKDKFKDVKAQELGEKIQGFIKKELE